MAAAGSVGAVAEDNDMFARGIIFSALPETQAIYGFLVAILLLVFSGLLGGGKGLPTEAGIVAIGVMICLLVVLSSLHYQRHKLFTVS